MGKFVRSLKNGKEGRKFVKRCLVFGENGKVGVPKRTVGEILGECEQLRSLWIVGAIGAEELDGSDKPFCHS